MGHKLYTATSKSKAYSTSAKGGLNQIDLPTMSCACKNADRTEEKYIYGVVVDFPPNK